MQTLHILNNKPQLVILDELDGAEGREVPGNAILAIVRLARKESASMRPVIGTCNNAYAKELRPLRTSTVAKFVKVDVPTIAALVDRLKHICADRHLKFEEQVGAGHTLHTLPVPKLAISHAPPALALAMQPLGLDLHCNRCCQPWVCRHTCACRHCRISSARIDATSVLASTAWSWPASRQDPSRAQ